MKRSHSLFYHQLITFCFISFGFTINAQEEFKIIESYKNYTKAPREIVYLHLNKSTYIIGETIGFTAYVNNKYDKKPSLLTTNLYISIEDENQRPIKQKLILVTNGVASNTFVIDSSFTEGNYRIKAFTNWMRNFNEPNYFEEIIRIKDLQSDEKKTTTIASSKIDAQFLPESGHLLHGVENTIGAIIKDSNGLGVPFVDGEVLNKNGDILTTFKTNKFGVGRFSLIADQTNNYKINLIAKNEATSVKLNQPIESQGIILTAKQLKNKVYVSAVTNTNTLELIKGRRYTLLLHNGKLADLIDLYFTDDTSVTKILDLTGRPGINIITLFDDRDKPIAERLVFNHKDIAIIKTDSDILQKQIEDSIQLKLNFKTLNPLQNHNISISVLPTDTKSYRRDNSIISKYYLQPYVNGDIENAKYYFTNITEKKKYELDNLLITEGWSSYDWNDIFNAKINFVNDYEQGIMIKANYNNIRGKLPKTLTYYFENENLLAVDVDQKNKSAIIGNLYPRSNNSIKLSNVTENGDLKPANLYLQYFPNQIPRLISEHKMPIISSLMITAPVEDFVSDNDIFQSSAEVEQLAEIVIKSNPLLKKRERQNNLSNGKFGRIKVVDKEDENSYVTLLNYLKFHAWNMSSNPFKTPNGSTTGVAGEANVELITDPFLAQTVQAGVNYFLNDVLIIEYSRIEEIFLSSIDYIEINRFGVSDGMRSPAGSIKIYTKDPALRRYNERLSKAYDFPLTFNDKKRFYTPKYRYYSDDFFKHYGTIDWKPNLSVDADGNATFKIQKPLVPITLFIEGIANDGSFIFEEKSITLN